MGEDPVFGQSLTREELTALEQKIRARPAHYVAQKQVMACTTPALIGEEVQPRRFVVRSYLSAYGDSYTVMNGGLSRITQSNDSLVVSLQKGGRSKDTWILSDGPVSPVTLLPSTTQPIAISRGGNDLPSRLAEDLFWLGRYSERTDAQARLARGTVARMVDQTGFDSAHAVQVLASACRNKPIRSTGAELEREFIEAMLGKAKGEGLRGSVANLHRLARVLRDTISTDAWRILQEIYRAVFNFKTGLSDPASGVLELLDNLIVTLAAFAGLASDSMTRGQAWRFLDIGRRVERASFISRFLRDSLTEPDTDPVLLEAVLDIGDSSLTYRRRYMTHLETHAVADLLLADETNPRSVAFQLALIDQHLGALPRDLSHPDRNHDQRLLLKLRTSIQLADFVELCSAALGPRAQGISRHAFRNHRTDRPAFRGHRPIVFFARRGIARNRRRSRGAPGLKYRVTHSTRFGYDEAIPLSHNVVRMKPREHDTQTCLQYQLLVLPAPTVRNDGFDYFGNHVTWFSLQEPHTVLRIAAQSEVQVLPSGPYDSQRRTHLGAGPANSEHFARTGKF